MKHLIAIIAAFVFAAPVFAYEVGESGRLQDVQMATVLAKRTVSSKEATSADNTVGTGLGALLGGLAGHKLGHGGKGKLAAAAVGAVVGGYAGNKATHAATVSASSEYILRFDNGRTVALVQKEGEGTDLIPGDRVYLLNGRITRAIRAEVAGRF